MSELSRREWFRSLLPAAGDFVARGLSMQLDRALPSYRRPPGAVLEASFLTLCTRCGACSYACPHAAVHTLCEDSGFAAGTPVMLPDRRACHMCEGFPCAEACSDGALDPVPKPTWELGKVVVAQERCLTFAGPECGACAGLCPQGSNALTLERGRPTIDPGECVGCGLCIESCPVIPAALELQSLR